MHNYLKWYITQKNEILIIVFILFFLELFMNRLPTDKNKKCQRVL